MEALTRKEEGASRLIRVYQEGKEERPIRVNVQRRGCKEVNQGSSRGRE